MSFKNIEKWSIGYWLLKGFSHLFYRIYYSEIHVKGKENVPKNAHIVFALNHQNALLDALALIFATRKQNVFLARADIFKNRRIASILYFLKILPVYRIRDGYSTLQKNDEVFKKTLDVFHAGKSIVILPEGTHEAMKILRPFKKGLARITFSAESALKDHEGILVIPVCIDYENYYTFRDRVVVEFGKAVNSTDIESKFPDNPAIALNELTKISYHALRQMVIHVDDKVNYPTWMRLAELKVANVKDSKTDNYYSDFLLFRKTINHLNKLFSESPGLLNDLLLKTETYTKELSDLKLTKEIDNHKDISFVENFLESLILIFTLPIFLFGILFNYLPYQFPAIFTRKIEDRVFHSSLKFVIWLVLFPLWYILLGVLFFLFLSQSLMLLFFMISLPLTGLYSFHYFRVFKSLVIKRRFRKLSSRQDDQLRKLINLKEEILLALNPK